MRTNTDRPQNEEGQALVLFALGLLAMIGFLAMSIDVGRFVWARTQMQAAVDAAVLAGAQSMPDQVDAEKQANDYWDLNSGFVQSQGKNVTFVASFPSSSNKGIHARADADVPTWFARFFGIDSWHVSAEGEAESQVLDIVLVLDTSGSMCFGTYPDVESTAWMGPGDAVSFLDQDISAGTTTFKVKDSDDFEKYYTQSYGGRKGTIKIDNELMRITSVDKKNDTITVTRAQPNQGPGGGSTSATAHTKGAEIWRNWNSCKDAAPSTKGPYQPYDEMIDDAMFFVSLFDDRYDKIGVGSFSTKAQHGRALTPNYSSVESTLKSLAIPDGSTNAAHGMAMGRQILDGGGKRANATRIVVFLTDGIANTYCGSSSYNASAYNSSSCSSGSGVSTAEAHFRAEAQRAKDGNIIIYTIGLGPDVNDTLLEQVATSTGGEYHKAPTSAQLDDAFEAIAESTHIKLSQ